MSDDRLPHADPEHERKFTHQLLGPSPHGVGLLFLCLEKGGENLHAVMWQPEDAAPGRWLDVSTELAYQLLAALSLDAAYELYAAETVEAL